MTQLRFAGMIVAVIFLSAFTFVNSTSWEIAEGYSIKFDSKDPSGVFTKMSGTIDFDEDNLEASKFDVQVDVNSINTGSGMKNKHAVSAKWFDAEQFPTINFTSSSFSKVDNGYEVVGTLELHGVAKEFTMPFTFENNTFESKFNINRTDFNLGKTKGMSGKVPLELAVELSVPVTK